MISRRKFVGGSVATLGVEALGNLRASAAGNRLPILKSAAARIGLLFGSGSDVAFHDAPAAYRDLFVEQCALYPGLFLWPQNCRNGDPSCPPIIDPNLSFVLANGIRLSGGHLMYSETMPDWFGKLGSAKKAEELMVRHINDLCSRYKGHVYSWNVFNEVFEPRQGYPLGLRHTPELRLMGLEEFDIALHAAREADPEALLLINEYSLEAATPRHEARRTALLRWLDVMQRRELPIDAVGIQSHLRTDAPFDSGVFRRFLHQLSSRGLGILLTELDVLDAKALGTIEQRDQTVAALYGDYLRTALDEPRVIAVITWGLCDRYTWLTPQRNADYGRVDGRPVRPLPFDDDLHPKAAFTAMIDAFAHAPNRNPLPPRVQRAPARGDPSTASGR